MKKKLFIVGILSIIILLPIVAGAEIVKIPNPLKCETEDNCVMEIIKAITSLIATIGSGIAVLMIVWAGIVYMTAGSDEEKTRNAKKTIQWALIGIAVIWSAKFLVDAIKEILGAI
jgi:uncharacterized membrane protein